MGLGDTAAPGAAPSSWLAAGSDATTELSMANASTATGKLPSSWGNLAEAAKWGGKAEGQDYLLSSQRASTVGTGTPASESAFRTLPGQVRELIQHRKALGNQYSNGTVVRQMHNIKTSPVLSVTYTTVR